MAVEQRPEILLITENNAVHLEMGRDGKFARQVNCLGREQSHPEGEEVVIRVGGGRWFIVKRPARGAVIGPGTRAKAEAPAPEADDVL
jgi:hypothetical protein